MYNLLPLWTYPVLGNHVNLLICVCFRSSMHNNNHKNYRNTKNKNACEGKSRAGRLEQSLYPIRARPGIVGSINIEFTFLVLAI